MIVWSTSLSCGEPLDVSIGRRSRRRRLRRRMDGQGFFLTGNTSDARDKVIDDLCQYRTRCYSLT